MKIHNRDIILITTFVVLGLLSRTVYHIGPNIELITALSITTPFFLKNKKLGLLVPFGAMILSDLTLGNTIIFTFTWSAFLLSPIIGMICAKFSKKYNFKIKALSLTGGALASNVIFFLWTNLGVVLTTSMYEKNIFGLMESYINALPFFRNQLISGLVFTPAIFTLTYLAFKLVKQLETSKFEKLHAKLQ